MLAVILVVEDDPTEQYVLRQLLSRFDYEADVVGSGEWALKALSITRYAAVIMDISLPGIDGLQCARQIRRNEQGHAHRTPVVGLTAYTDQADHQACLQAGMDDYLGKPFEPEQL